MRACFFVYLVFALQDGYCKGWTNGVFRLGLASLVVSHVMRVLSALHWTVSFFLCLQLGLTKYWIVLFMEVFVWKSVLRFFYFWFCVSRFSF